VLSQQVPSGLTSLRWPDSITIFNEYYKAEVPLKAKFLPLFEKCQNDSVIKCLFDGYLAKLFGFKVDYQPTKTAVELNKEIENGKFQESLQKFMQRTDKSMQEEDATQSKRVRVAGSNPR
ncbi:10273_t:CDS:2, partial [Paraglomus brasilianum]